MANDDIAGHRQDSHELKRIERWGTGGDLDVALAGQIAAGAGRLLRGGMAVMMLRLRRLRSVVRVKESG